MLNCLIGSLLDNCCLLFMELVGIISSVVAAIAAIVAVCFAVRTSKGNIHRRIDKKEAQIRRIDDQMIRKYGINGRRYNVITPLDEKRRRLQSEISELQRML